MFVSLAHLWPITQCPSPIYIPLMSTEVLVAKKSEEKASAVFTKMPSPHYMELASLLLNRWMSYAVVNSLVSKQVGLEWYDRQCNTTSIGRVYHWTWGEGVQGITWDLLTWQCINLLSVPRMTSSGQMKLGHWWKTFGTFDWPNSERVSMLWSHSRKPLERYFTCESTLIMHHYGLLTLYVFALESVKYKYP